MIIELKLNIYNNHIVKEFFKNVFKNKILAPVFSEIKALNSYTNDNDSYFDEAGNICLKISIMYNKTFTLKSLANALSKFVKYLTNNDETQYTFTTAANETLSISINTLKLIHDICLSYSSEKLIEKYGSDMLNEIVGIPNDPFIIELIKEKKERLNTIEEEYSHKFAVEKLDFIKASKNLKTEYEENKKNLINEYTEKLRKLNAQFNIYESISIFEGYLKQL